jgi:archaemetzincin
MGLGMTPGNSAVISTYRLSKTNTDEQLYKLALHEFGHTQGLQHCPDPNCLMRDAEGGNPLNDEKSFCQSCTQKLDKRGWTLAIDASR